MKVVASIAVRLACFLALIVSIGQTASGQWISRASGLPPWDVVLAMDACDSNTAVVLLDTAIFRTVDGGATWRSIGKVPRVVDVSVIDSSHVWVATAAGQIFGTTNGGQSWVRQFVDSSKCTFMDYVKMFDLNNGIGMGDGISLAGPALFVRTTDGGATWTSMNDSAFGGWSLSLWSQVSFVNLNVGYFFEMGVNPNHLYKTTDGGAAGRSQISALQTSLL